MKPAVRMGILALTASLGACTGAAPVLSEPPRIVSQPYYEPVLVDWALAYREQLAGPLPFDLTTDTQAEALRAVEEGEAALLITSGEPPDKWFATPLEQEAMAVIVHPDNPVRDLELDELQDLFTGRSSSWESVGGRDVPVQPVLPLPGEPIGDAFRARVLAGVRPWPGTLLAPNAAEALKAVVEEKGALGLIPLAAVTPDVRVIRIGGILPGESTVGDGSYPLTVQLFATAPEEPGSPLRDFLVWIQSQVP
ncbi:MAG TPA: substrate-binding domain-containing protein [Anaerolineales bacterium]|nr:substrate-binding domain-containing protein [Anaerolineales bacterium]